VPAEARAGRPMQLRKHLRQGRPVAVALQVELLEEDEIRTVIEDPRNADNGAERLQAIYLGIGRRSVLAESFSQTPNDCSRG